MYDDDSKNVSLAKSRRVQIIAGLINQMNLQGKKIMDIGCYDGAQLELIKNRNNAFYGIEASDYGFNKCRDKGINVNNFFFDDKTPLPYENEMFNLVIAGEIIEHIYDTDFFLSEIRRVLNGNGSLLISTPNIASFGRRILLLLGKSPLIENSPNEEGSCGHIRYFTFETLKNILNKHGFEIVKSFSDETNFSASGKLRSYILARIFPSVGRSIIYLCKKSEIKKVC